MKTNGEQALRALATESRLKWGLVLGSGLGGLAEEAEIVDVFPYDDFREVSQSLVEGHAGRFVVGRISGVPVLVAEGRAHLYESFTAREVTAGIRLMAACGVERLVLTNAAGSLDPEMPPGTWMLLADHLNLTGTSPLIGGPGFVDMTTAYSPALRKLFAKAAQDEGLLLREGIYAGVAGPQYETPAEVRMLARMGAHAVGMSTVLETIQARALGLEVAGLSCLTNWAAGLGAGPLSHAEVLERGRTASKGLPGVLRRVFSHL